MKIRKPTSAGAVFAGVILVLSLALVPAAFAGKGGGTGGHGGTGTGSGSYTVSVSPGGSYSFGEEVWTTTNAPQVSQSYISLLCYQNGVLVLSGSHANWSGGWYFNSPWYLGPTQSWTSGSANCTVTVFHTSNNKQVTDATTSFTVS